jgi:hypothetical protein
MTFSYFFLVSREGADELLLCETYNGLGLESATSSEILPLHSE